MRAAVLGVHLDPCAVTPYTTVKRFLDGGISARHAIVDGGNVRVYWANSFFSVADAEYNKNCVRELRSKGYHVFIPQASASNRRLNIRRAEIFARDEGALRKADVLVACIDQETIDSGVACEIGIAYALGIPIVGLLTDLRWRRRGEGRIYKNPFVLGCIGVRGRVVHSLKEVMRFLASRGVRSS